MLALLSTLTRDVRAAGGALIVIFFQCSLVGAYELLCSSKGDDELEDQEP